MRWKNKGHEYDTIYKRIEEIKGFYLFGAGDYGNQFFHMIDKELPLISYIDNSPKKQGMHMNGLEICAFPEKKIAKEQAFILTVSQIQRMKMVDQLEEAGYVRNEDFFLIEEFISVYYVYKYNKVYFSTISMIAGEGTPGGRGYRRVNDSEDMQRTAGAGCPGGCPRLRRRAACRLRGHGAVHTGSQVHL